MSIQTNRLAPEWGEVKSGERGKAIRDAEKVSHHKHEIATALGRMGL
ncbi:hypothetical protein RvY_13862 [Ramazzottius varieornatus]|uniref:Uncharacterized protein n=1 Tax=Ramazzottius varieornatus TaxID=947166 RepID=A0A1D1VXW0_RAMVA|nr:hypothetical protein RvY_13862 [Ramazzottius varieornatus]